MHQRSLTEEQVSEFNPFFWIERHWKELLYCTAVITVITVITILASLPEAENVFIGKIIRIEPEQFVVYVRNNRTVSGINATYGVCYDKQLMCYIHDNVEITQYVSYWGEYWTVTAIVD